MWNWQWQRGIYFTISLSTVWFIKLLKLTQVNLSALLGHDFIYAFGLQLRRVVCNNLQENSAEFILKQNYAVLFSNDLGKFNKYKVNLRINSTADFF